MQIIPTRDHLYIYVKKQAQETTTHSGIILKNSTVQSQTIGHVISVGEGRLLNDGVLVPVPFKAGDQILFYDYIGVKILPEDAEPDKEYLIIKCNDIIALLK